MFFLMFLLFSQNIWLKWIIYLDSGSCDFILLLLFFKKVVFMHRSNRTWPKEGNVYLTDVYWGATLSYVYVVPTAFLLEEPGV